MKTYTLKVIHGELVRNIKVTAENDSDAIDEGITYGIDFPDSVEIISCDATLINKPQ